MNILVFIWCWWYNFSSYRLWEEKHFILKINWIFIYTFLNAFGSRWKVYESIETKRMFFWLNGGRSTNIFQRIIPIRNVEQKKEEKMIIWQWYSYIFYMIINYFYNLILQVYINIYIAYAINRKPSFWINSSKLS